MIEMRLWDTAGQEDYERLRILAYEGVDVVIMAFSLVNKNSFDNIFDKWIPEYKQHLAGIPVYKWHLSYCSYDYFLIPDCACWN